MKINLKILVLISFGVALLVVLNQSPLLQVGHIMTATTEDSNIEGYIEQETGPGLTLLRWYFCDGASVRRC